MAVFANTAEGKISITAFVRNLRDERVPSIILADPVATVSASSTGRTDAAFGGDYWPNFWPNSFRTIDPYLGYRI